MDCPTPMGFVLARITEDEEAAREATEGPWTAYGDGVILGASKNPEVCRQVKTWNLEHIARHHPTRVLADCAGKRRLVAVHDDTQWCNDEDYDSPRFGCYECDGPCLILQALARPYCTHPDYKRIWS